MNIKNTFRTIAFLIFLIITVYLISMGENYLGDEAAKRIHIWAQFLTGPWPRWEEAAIDRKSIEFSMGVVTRFVLVIGVLSTVYRILQTWLIREKREAMNYMKIVTARDALIKTCLLDTIPLEQKEEMVKVIDSVFEKASSEWEQIYLPILFGKDLSKKLLAEMKKETNIPAG